MKTKWVVGLTLAIVPGALMAAPGASTAQPGTVNYVEGQVSINGTALSRVQNGSAALAAGQTLSVGTGKAEILLTPGSFLRAGNGATVRMVSTDLADPQVEIARGEALIEVNYKPKDERLDVREAGADTMLLKEGLYRFNADQKSVQVIDGKASVEENGHSKEIGKGKELMLASATLKPASFDTKSTQSEDALYRWSSVRDGYLAQASEASARNVYVDGGYGYGYAPWGPGWGLGWAWNPYYGTYAWLPYDGYFWSPFGYPFFAPSYIAYAPIVRYRGFPGRVTHIAGAAVPGRVGGVAAAPRVSSPGVARGFAGGGGGFRGGGGFHGGGGRR